MGERYKRNPNTKCAICSRAVYRRPIQLAESNGRAFCGQACYGISNRKETPCVICHVPILASAHKKTCSRACANKYRTGIHYKIGRPRDKVVAARMMRVRLLEERGVACERCAYSKKEILHVHHKDRNRNNNDPSNLELI